jgi:2-hydroxy-3-oxopropionate reductase
VLGVKAGLDPDAMLAVINAGSGRNSATLDKFPRSVLTRTFDFGFPISLYCKDIHLALAEGERLGVNQWMGQTAAQLYDYARYRGGGSEDLTAIIRYIEAMAGVVVVGREARKRGMPGRSKRR